MYYHPFFVAKQQLIELFVWFIYPKFTIQYRDIGLQFLRYKLPKGGF